MINETVLLKIAVVDMKGFMDFAMKYGQAMSAIKEYNTLLSGKINFSMVELDSPEIRLLEKKEKSIDKAVAALLALGSKNKSVGKLVTHYVSTDEQKEDLLYNIESIVSKKITIAK